MKTGSYVNPDLAAALANATAQFDLAGYLDDRIKEIGNSVGMDRFLFRSVSYSRRTDTTAMLLAGDTHLRTLARAKGIDLRAFDNVIGQVQQLILDHTNKETPGKKMANALMRFCDL